MNKSNTEDFIRRANIIHKNKYDYSKTIYLNFKTEVVIICPIHGEFQCLPCRHIQKIGCIECSKEKNKKLTDSFRMSKEAFIKRHICATFHKNESPKVRTFIEELVGRILIEDR